MAKVVNRGRRQSVELVEVQERKRDKERNLLGPQICPLTTPQLLQRLLHIGFLSANLLIFP